VLKNNDAYSETVFSNSDDVPITETYQQLRTALRNALNNIHPNQQSSNTPPKSMSHDISPTSQTSESNFDLMVQNKFPTHIPLKRNLSPKSYNDSY